MRAALIISLTIAFCTGCASTSKLDEPTHLENISNGSLNICFINSKILFEKYYLTSIARSECDSNKIHLQPFLIKGKIDSSNYKDKMVSIDRILTKIVIEELNNKINEYCSSISLNYMLDMRDTSLIFASNKYSSYFKKQNGEINQDFVFKILPYAKIDNTASLVQYANKSENQDVISKIHEISQNTVQNYP